MGVKPPMAWAKFFYHVIWITVVFRSNNSRWLLWKFSAIRVTRWLFLASKLHKIQFWPPLTPLGSLRRSSRPSSQLGRGKPPPHSLPSSTPSASRCRRRILGIYGASTLTPPHWQFLATPLQTQSVGPVRTAHMSVLLTVNIVSHNPARSSSDNILS